MTSFQTIMPGLFGNNWKTTKIIKGEKHERHYHNQRNTVQKHNLTAGNNRNYRRRRGEQLIMALNFKKIAKSATILSDLMEGRVKVTKSDGVYNITEFDIVPNAKGEQYVICAISDTEFINGGYILTKIFNEFIAMNDGDITATREEFKNSGGIRVKLEKTMTTSGKNLTKVEVLED